VRLAGAVALAALPIAVLAYQSWLRFGPAIDFAVYRDATAAFWHGANPYAADTPAPFIYPLFLCVVLWPLTQVPLGVAGVIWFVASGLALGLALAVTLRLDGPVRVVRAVTAAAIVCILQAAILQGNFRNGQINFLVLGCTLAFAWCWSRQRRWLASFWLAVAIALKITPGIFLIMLARRRDWRAIAAAMGVAVVLMIGVPLVAAGPRIFDDYGGYASAFLAERAGSGADPIVERRPFSVAGALHRFTDISWPFDSVMLGLAMLAITALLVDRRPLAGDRRITGSVCLYLVTALLATPMSEVHHLAFVLPALVWLTYRTLGGEMSREQIAALICIFAALMARRVFHVAVFAGVVGLWALLAIALLRQRNVAPVK